MRTIKNQLEISAPVERVFKWFVNLDSNYLNWHPETHEEFKWLSKKPISKGSRFYFIETVNGHRHRVFLEVIEHKKNAKLSFRSINIEIFSNNFSDKFISFLASLFQIKIEMKRNFQPISDNSTILYTTHKFGCNLPIVKFVVDWFIEKFIFPKIVHEKHMKEENNNMKRCL